MFYWCIAFSAFLAGGDFPVRLKGFPDLLCGIGAFRGSTTFRTLAYGIRSDVTYFLAVYERNGIFWRIFQPLHSRHSAPAVGLYSPLIRKLNIDNSPVNHLWGRVCVYVWTLTDKLLFKGLIESKLNSSWNKFGKNLLHMLLSSKIRFFEVTHVTPLEQGSRICSASYSDRVLGLIKIANTKNRFEGEW